MPRRFFRKIMPDEAKMRQNWALRLFGSTLLSRRLWVLNRHSVAWGSASGMFWAWIALPIQTVGAVATAVAGRGNVPLGMAFTWISNPLTWLPCFWIDYRLGVWLTRGEPLHWTVFKGKVGDIMSSGLIGGLQKTGGFLVSFYPMYVGGAVIGAVTGTITYFAIRVLWRWNLVRRWHRRHDDRRRVNPALRLTSGFAHLYRRARHAS